MGIINGSFEEGLYGWNFYGFTRAYACLGSRGRKACLVSYWNESDGTLEQEFVIDGCTISFFWTVYGNADWSLIVEGNVVYQERLFDPSAYSWGYSWGVIMKDTSMYVGKAGKIIFKLYRPDDYRNYRELFIDEVYLAPCAGSINFSSEPQGAKIFIDGTDTGKVTPATVENVLVGMHAYTLVLEGYKDYSGTVEVEVQLGLTSYVHAVLIPRVGNLYMTTIPQGAGVYLDEVHQGVVTPALITGIKIGMHTYRLVRAGLEYSGTVEILEDQTVSLEILAAARVPLERIIAEKIPFERIPAIPTRGR